MPSHQPSEMPRPRSRHLGLLVLGLLIGLLGMHGLGSVPPTHTETRTSTQAPTHTQAPEHAHTRQAYAPAQSPTHAHPALVATGAGHATAPVDPPDAHGHDDDGGGHHGRGTGGHPEHADSTCASGAVTGSPALVAPPALTIGDIPRAQESETVSWIGTDGCRAPPSLAQLQLLRI